MIINNNQDIFDVIQESIEYDLMNNTDFKLFKYIIYDIPLNEGFLSKLGKKYNNGILKNQLWAFENPKKHAINKMIGIGLGGTAAVLFKRRLMRNSVSELIDPSKGEIIKNRKINRGLAAAGVGLSLYTIKKEYDDAKKEYGKIPKSWISKKIFALRRILKRLELKENLKGMNRNNLSYLKETIIHAINWLLKKFQNVTA